jgi:hypothetical protein
MRGFVHAWTENEFCDMEAARSGGEYPNILLTLWRGFVIFPRINPHVLPLHPAGTLP